MPTPKFTDLLVNPKPFEYDLLPYRPKRFTQVHFEQEEVQNLTLTQDRPKVNFYKKIKYDRNAYVPLEFVNWEKSLEYMLQGNRTESNNKSTKNTGTSNETNDVGSNMQQDISIVQAMKAKNYASSSAIPNAQQATNSDIASDKTNAQDTTIPQVSTQTNAATKPQYFKDDLALHLFFEDVFSQKWESFIDKTPPHLILYYQDPNLIFSNVEKKKRKKSKYNLSNDKHYMFKKAKKEDNLNVYGVQHSVPALKLDPIYYKTHLTKDDLRQYCKKYLKIENMIFKFMPLNDSVPVFIKKAQDLTTSDNTDTILIEYCDEYPMFINKEGMVSLINNYHKEGSKDAKKMRRKEGIAEDVVDNKSDLRPCARIDAPDTRADTKHKKKVVSDTGIKFKDIQLSNTDPSPLPHMSIRSGHSLTLIANNMFKAPLYRQKVKLFLVTYSNATPQQHAHCSQSSQIPSQMHAQMNSQPVICAASSICISTIKPVTLFTCNTLFPIIEVFSPHSKLLNSYCKNRLKIAANTLTQKVIRMKDLDDLFPLFSEGSKRKWLKEYTERKQSCNEIYYKDEEITITPENVVQYESMLLSERLLKDKIIENEECFWNCTRNFIKGNVEVENKEDFYNEKFSYQRSIKENLNEIIQKKMNDEEAFVSKEFKLKDLKEKDYKEIVKIHHSTSNKTSDDQGSASNDNNTKITSNAHNNTSNNTNNNGRSIIVRRVINGVNEEELITDEDVINEYLKERKKLKENIKKNQLKCGRCGEIGHMKTNKTCPFYNEGLKMSKKKKEALKRKLKGIISEIIMNVVVVLFNVPLSSVFYKPVNIKKFTNYLQFIENPIDLGTIKNKVRQNKYKKYVQFQEDVILMRDNCVKYNGVDHSFSKVANEMMDIVVKAGIDKKDEIEEAERNIDEISNDKSITDA